MTRPFETAALIFRAAVSLWIFSNPTAAHRRVSPCPSYVIKAMENCGFHVKDIHQVLVELYEVFDFCAVEEAAHYYENWQY